MPTKHPDLFLAGLVADDELVGSEDKAWQRVGDPLATTVPIVLASSIQDLSHTHTHVINVDTQ